MTALLKKFKFCHLLHLKLTPSTYPTKEVLVEQRKATESGIAVKIARNRKKKRIRK